MILRIKRSRDNRIGGGARCSRRHAPRSSKIVISQSRACSTAMSIDDLAMSATTRRLDAVTAVVACHFRSCQRETEFLLDRARQETTHAVLLPVCRLHHLFDASPLGSAQQCENAVLLAATSGLAHALKGISE
jgi:hypothetical protein